MAVTDFSVPGKESDIGKKHGPPSSVSLNDIFRDSMKRAGVSNTTDIIVRCESLPFIPGSEADFRELFDHLLSLILQMSEAGAQLFLHVNCDEESVSGGPLNKKYRNHIIRFHTNFSTGDEWKEMNVVRLSRCNEIISNYDGSFMVNNISNTGCLFYISLPVNHK